MGQHGQYDAARYDDVLSLFVVWKAVLLQNAQSIREIVQGIPSPLDTVHHFLVDKGMHAQDILSFL
jgi:hypothetical protein